MKKKITALLTALALILSVACLLTSCGAKEDKIVGKWQMDLDLAEALIERIAAEDPDMASYFATDTFPLAFIFEFRENGEFTFALDLSGAKSSFLSYIEKTLRPGFSKYVEDMFVSQGISLDALATLGMDLGTLIDEAIGELDIEKIVGELTETTAGTYRIEGDRIYLTETASGETSSFEYELKNGELVIKSISGVDDDSLASLPGFSLPIVLKKI